MSYKLSILNDNPIAYYPLDDLEIEEVIDFTDLLSHYSTYQDVLDNFDFYANIYGNVAYDQSGYENDSIYTNVNLEHEFLPLVVGSVRATKVDNVNFISYKIENGYESGQ